MMMIKMMIIIVVSRKTENICGRRPLPPIISHSFPLSNSALSTIGSRKLPVQVEVEVLLLSHRKIPLQLCSQQRIGVKPITNSGKSYFSSHQVCKMLCFIVKWRNLDSLHLYHHHHCIHHINVLKIIRNIKIIIIIVNWIISGRVEEITMSRVPCSQSSVIQHNSSRDSGARVVEYI